MTTWSRFDNHWRGVRFKTLAELVVPNEDASHVLCTGYDHSRAPQVPYTTNLPLARAWKTTSCWCTRGRASPCRANMVDR